MNKRKFVANNQKSIADVLTPQRRRVQLRGVTDPTHPHFPVFPNVQAEPVVPDQRDLMDERHHTQTTKQSVGSDATTEVPTKKVRGKSRGIAADRLFHDRGSKLPLKFEDKKGRPTGAYAQYFSNEIGFTVRNHVPFDVEKWKKVPLEVKAKWIKRLNSKYEFDMNNPIFMRYLDRSFGAAFSNFRSTVLKKHFLRWETMEEALKNKHPEVKTQGEWVFLCYYFSSDAFKVVSQKSTSNRSLLKYHHKASSKSFMSHKEEMEKTGEILGPIKHFEMEYKSDTKGWDLEAKLKWEEMVNLRTIYTEPDGTQSITDAEICKLVIGSKSGYIKSCGFGPRPTPSNTSYAALNGSDKNKELEDKLEETQGIVQAQSVVIAELKERSKRMEELMEKVINNGS